MALLTDEGFVQLGGHGGNVAGFAAAVGQIGGFQHQLLPLGIHVTARKHFESKGRV